MKRFSFHVRTIIIEYILKRKWILLSQFFVSEVSTTPPKEWKARHPSLTDHIPYLHIDRFLNSNIACRTAQIFLMREIIQLFGQRLSIIFLIHKILLKLITKRLTFKIPFWVQIFLVSLKWILKRTVWLIQFLGQNFCSFCLTLFNQHLK